MKKIFFIATFLCCMVTFSQDFSKNAIGLRLGDNDGFGSEISYKRALNDKNRLEINLGWRNSGKQSATKITGLYQWVYDIDNGFNWYAGAGGGLGSWSFPGEKSLIMFIAGNVGIEYQFDFPMEISLDIRPELYFSNALKSNFAPDIGLGLRYKFD